MFLHFHFVTDKAVEMQTKKNVRQKCHKILIYELILKFLSSTENLK